MRYLIPATALVAAIVGIAFAAEKELPPKRSGVLAVLEKDMKVSLKDTGSGFQIAVMPGVEMPSKVIEVGADYVVIEDIAGITQTRIPIYAIKSVTVTKIEVKKGK